MVIKFPELDDRCKKILLMVLISKEGKLRFTKISDALKGLNIGMTKPTLAQHLKHLEKEKLVTKKEKHKNVTYAVRDDFMNLKPFLDKTTDKIFQEIREMAEAKKAFMLMPVKDQVEEVLLKIVGRDLLSIASKIQFESEGKIEYGLLSLILEFPYFKLYEEWLKERCLHDKAHRREVLQRIDELLGRAGFRGIVK